MQIAAIFVCNLLLSHSNNSHSSNSSSSRSNNSNKNCCCCCSCFRQLQLEARQTPRKEKLCRPLQVTFETSYVGESGGKIYKSNRGKVGAEWQQRDLPHSGSLPINAVKFIMPFAFGMSAGRSDSEHSLWQLFIRSLALTRSPSLSLLLSLSHSLFALCKPQLVA